MLTITELKRLPGETRREFRRRKGKAKLADGAQTLLGAVGARVVINRADRRTLTRYGHRASLTIAKRMEKSARTYMSELRYLMQ